MSKKLRKKSLVGYVTKVDYKQILSYVKNWYYWNVSWNVSKKRIEKEDVKVRITISELPQKGRKG